MLNEKRVDGVGRDEVVLDEAGLRVSRLVVHQPLVALVVAVRELFHEQIDLLRLAGNPEADQDKPKLAQDLEVYVVLNSHLLVELLVPEVVVGLRVQTLVFVR